MTICGLSIIISFFHVRNGESTTKWIEFDSKDFSKISFDWNHVQAQASNDAGIFFYKSLGPHKVDIMTQCTRAKFWAQVSKDALVDVKLEELRPGHWAGTFSLPIEGEYEFQLNWNGCSKNEENRLMQTTIEQFQAQGESSKDVQSEDDTFSKGAWISSSKIQHESSSDSLPEFVWIDPGTVLQKKKNVASIKGAKTFVAKEGVVTEQNGFFEFTKLSNYELVCFFGSQSARDIRDSFLSLRPQLFGHQRPFKFHYYNVTNFVTPDAHWDEGKKKGFRKCKHVLISIDEPDVPLKQSEYKAQVTTLIKHITTALNDETFPIWMFTSLESPIDSINSKNCNKSSGRGSSDHPCNTALKEIFHDSPFSSRVHLLDNTDLSNPQFHDSREAVLAAVALRIFVVVGKQVKAWRDKGQIGHVKGLTKGDKEYQNFSLVPYDFTRN